MKSYPMADKYIERVARGIPLDRCLKSNHERLQLALEISEMGIELAANQMKGQVNGQEDQQ